MISIRKTTTELDRLADLHQTAAECYAFALLTAAEYVVAIEPRSAADFQRHLQRLSDQWRGAGTPPAMLAVQSYFRGELRQYQTKAAELLQRQRTECESAVAALSTLAQGVAASDADHDKQVTHELDTLQAISMSENLSEIRAGINSSAESIRRSFVEMRDAHQLMITQLTDEIRMLHHENDAERRALTTDAGTGAWNRQKITTRIDEALSRSDPFQVVLIRLGYPQLWKEPLSPEILNGALKAAVMRLQKLLGDDAVIGRWTTDHFIAILLGEASHRDNPCREIELHLSGDHPVQADGISHNVRFDVTARLLSREPGSDPSAFSRQLERLEAVLAH